MRVYLDASMLVALLTQDSLTDRAEAFLRRVRPVLLISDFAAAEFSSALARRVRTGEILVDDARAAFAALDLWSFQAAERVETVSSDIRAAEGFLRRLDCNLRTPDALNIAIAQRVRGALATFDVKMAKAAEALGSELCTCT